MDAFSFHPYPNRATDPLDRGYGWPNAGFVNLDRVKQALWDAFNGTAQPTTMDGLPLHLDEVGWQVTTEGRDGYTGLENVVVTDELTQAAIYADLVRRAACDPDVAEMSFFGFRDDGSRTGFQAALQRVDGSARPAAEAVRAAIAEAASGGCVSAPVTWQPHRQVLAPSVSVTSSPRGNVDVHLRAGEDAEAVVCAGTAAIGVFRPPTTARAGGARSARTSCRNASLLGHELRDVSFVSPPSAGKSVAVAVKLVAAANRARLTILVRRATLQR
jgi:hypothetical protein